MEVTWLLNLSKAMKEDEGGSSGRPSMAGERGILI